MSSKLNHKKRSRKTHGHIVFKSKDRAFHEFDPVLGVIYKKSKNRHKY